MAPCLQAAGSGIATPGCAHEGPHPDVMRGRLDDPGASWAAEQLAAGAQSKADAESAASLHEGAGAEAEVLRPGPEAGLSMKVRPDIEQRFCAVKSDADRCAMLLELLPWLERNGAGKIIVYTNERKDAESLERDLAAFRERSISVRKLTGDMRPAEREAAFKQFAHGDVRVLVTTNVLGRAIDVPGVRLVVHFDLPCRGVRLEYAEYVQRCGRAGRYMSSGMTLAFVVDDRPATRELLRQASAREASLVEVQGMDELSAQLDEVLEL